MNPPTPAIDQATLDRRSGRGNGGRGRGGRRRRSRDTDPCRLCGQLGHWANECDQRHVKPIVKGVMCPKGAPTRVYVMARYRNHPIRCLLDSGCERSVIGRRYLRGASIKRTRYALSASNKTALPIDGDVDLHFTIEGHAMTTDVSVSPAIDELLLGGGWLVENKCRWDFAAGTVNIGDHLVHTHRCEQVDAYRRIFVQEGHVVPPRHENDTPVMMMYDMTIRHRPGRVYSNSDALSRRPCDCAGDPECRQCKRPSSRRVEQSARDSNAHDGGGNQSSMGSWRRVHGRRREASMQSTRNYSVAYFSVPPADRREMRTRTLLSAQHDYQTRGR